MTRSFRAAIIAWCLSAVTAGCNQHAPAAEDASGTIDTLARQTPSTELHSFCFSGAKECESYVVDLLLHLDTVNLPSQNNSIEKLVLCDLPTVPICNGYRLEYFFTGELSADIDPGALNKSGWKVKIKGAAIEYCKVCYTNSGLADIISLKGSIENAEFIEDPSGKQSIHILKSKMTEPDGGMNDH